MVECQQAFETVKEKLLSAPALGFPNPQKPSSYTCMKNGIGLGVLVQMLGDMAQPIAYFFKRLEQHKRWPPCRQAVTATCDILQAAGKLTLGQ